MIREGFGPRPTLITMNEWGSEMPEYFHKVVGPIELTEDETSALIRFSDGRPLALSFGSSVWLDANKSAWAVPILSNMRGLNSTGRGGVIIWGASEE